MSENPREPEDEGSLKELVEFWTDQANENREFGERDTQQIVRDLRDAVDKLDGDLNDSAADDQIQNRIDEIGGFLVELELNRRTDSENQHE